MTNHIESNQGLPVRCPKCKWRGFSKNCYQGEFTNQAYCPDCWLRNDIVAIENEEPISIKSVWDMVASTSTESLPDFKYSPEAMQRINEAIAKFQAWQKEDSNQTSINSMPMTPFEISQISKNNLFQNMMGCMHRDENGKWSVSIEGIKNACENFRDVVPVEITPDMMKDFQLNTEIGAIICSKYAGAYSMFDELWQHILKFCPNEKELPQTEELKQIIYALERSAKGNEELADQLMAANDYSAEFPASDATQIRKAIDLLNGAKPQAQAEPVAWHKLTDQCPRFADDNRRVVIYTQDDDFGGVQFFEVNADHLCEASFQDEADQPEECRLATHWIYKDDLIRSIKHIPAVPAVPDNIDCKDLLKLRPFYTRTGAIALIKKHWPDMFLKDDIAETVRTLIGLVEGPTGNEVRYGSQRFKDTLAWARFYVAGKKLLAASPEQQGGAG